MSEAERLERRRKAMNLYWRLRQAEYREKKKMRNKHTKSWSALK